MNTRRYVIAAAALLILFFLVWIVWPSGSKSRTAPAGEIAPVGTTPVPTATASITTVFAHNLELRKGPQFRIYVRWIRGRMLPTRAGVVPSLDDESSFLFQIDRGLIHVNLGDIGNYLNSAMASRSPLKDMKLTGEGQEIRLAGVMHKLLIPLPVEVLGTIEPASGGRIHVKIRKISVLKMPVKGLLSGLRVEVDDIVGKEPVDGVEVRDNDIYLNTTALLPPPHIRGQISGIELHAPDAVVTCGNTSANEDQQLAQWHNFLRLRGGSVGFGKLVMNDADLTLIDASDDTWFDLDLGNYHDQLVKGYSRITPDRGLEMFMPDVGRALPAGAISLDTLRDKSKPLPSPTIIR